MKAIEISVVLNDDQAWEYAQFLKRVCFSDYERRAANEREAYTMLEAGEKIRDALREKGYAPRTALETSNRIPRTFQESCDKG